MPRLLDPPDASAHTSAAVRDVIRAQAGADFWTGVTPGAIRPFSDVEHSANKEGLIPQSCCLPEFAVRPSKYRFDVFLGRRRDQIAGHEITGRACFVLLAWLRVGQSARWRCRAADGR